MADRRHLRRGTALLVTGFALAAGGTALLVWPEPRVAADVGSVLTAPADPSPTVTPPATPPVGQPPAVSVPPPAPAPSGFVPERLLVESLDIDAPLVATGVDADGALVPPEDPARLAWWRGVRPGQGAGSVVVAGHLDMYGYGEGPLARLVRLEPGDRAAVTGADGAVATYVLRGVTTFEKETLPAAELFGTGGPERLVLVTCGGTYDREARSWNSNVVAVLDPFTTG